MSAGEVFYRGKELLRKTAEKNNRALAILPDFISHISVSPWIVLPPNLDLDHELQIIHAADLLLAGTWPVFGKSVVLGMPPKWRVDSLTGIESPLTYGMNLAIGNRAIVGDIKYLWEPARHLEWVRLAQAWAITKDSKYLTGLAVCVSSWLNDAPYPLGPHWSSSLELAIRLINWSMVWQLIGQEDSELWQGDEGQRLLRAWYLHIYQSMFFIRHHLSRHSSANNHLIGELAGLYIACSAWPKWNDCIVWRKFAKDELAQEVLLQNTEDGVNREQAISYQQFVFEFIFWAGKAAESTDDAFTAAYWDRLCRMAEWIALLRDYGGHIPNIGDADDGYVSRLFPQLEHDPYAQTLHIAGEVFGIAAWKQTAPISLASLWCLSVPLYKSVSFVPEFNHSRYLAGGGYAVVGSDFGLPSEVKLVLDSGPLGYLGIAAHGHADALSVLLSVAGQPVLVDAGTYSYHADGGWRDYFRGTFAHNTMSINGLDQSVSGGKFMWVKHCATQLEHFQCSDDSIRWAASHTGYARLSSKVIHRRCVAYYPLEKKITILDELESAEDCDVSINWQHAANVKVKLQTKGWGISLNGYEINVVVNGPNYILKEFYGQEIPIAGWVSEQYGEKQPATQISCQATSSGKAAWLTEFTIESAH